MDFWIPFGVCVVLPIAIVLIVFLTKINSDNKRAQVLIKAIESNNDINTDKLVEAMQNQKKSALDTYENSLPARPNPLTLIPPPVGSRPVATARKPTSSSPKNSLRPKNAPNNKLP